VTPRLVNLQGVAHYLGVSVWTARPLAGPARVRLPGVRRELYDLQALDRLIATWSSEERST
jgi:hypothetical protein